jgi:hypothetical protein
MAPVDDTVTAHTTTQSHKKAGVPRLSQLTLIMKAMSAKEGGMSTTGLCVDPRVQPLSLHAMLDTHGNLAPDQAKMVQQSDGSWVESSTPDPVSKKAHTALEVARGHIMYWTAHLVTVRRLTNLHSRYDGRNFVSVRTIKEGSSYNRRNVASPVLCGQVPGLDVASCGASIRGHARRDPDTAAAACPRKHQQRGR